MGLRKHAEYFFFETAKASRQKELALVYTENPVTVQHVKVDY